MKKSLLILLLGLYLQSLNAQQLSGYMLSEYQLGNLPETEPDDLSGLYNQLNVRYSYKKLRVSARLENYYSTDTIDRDYFKPSQLNLTYQDKGFKITAGHFYETLGKGLLYRGYEIPGSIFEDRAYRVRYGFYRDLRGLGVQYRNQWLMVKAIRGKSLDNLFPPTFEDEDLYKDLIEALESNVSFLQQRLGIIAMRHELEGNTQSFASAYLEGNLPFNIYYYMELAQNVSDQDILEYSNSASKYGFYSNLNTFYNFVGLSAEYKKYQNMIIGTGITDPPTLIKEHSYRLLNRNVHVSDVGNEEGYQLEVYFNLPAKQMITFNNAWTVNRYGSFDFYFREYFLEYYLPLEKLEQKYFVDFAHDDIKNHHYRVTTGLYNTIITSPLYNLKVNLEHQVISKDPDDKDKMFTNLFADINFSRSSLYTVGVQVEYTNDPADADRPSTEKVEDNKIYPALVLSYLPNSNQQVSLFAGERRGGPACVSGICYDVLDFKGIELRYKINF